MIYSERVPLIKREKEIIELHMPNVSAWIEETLEEVFSQYNVKIEYLSFMVKSTIERKVKERVISLLSADEIDITLFYQAAISAYVELIEKNIKHLITKTDILDALSGNMVPKFMEDEENDQ